jgi:hypothetical protein
VRLTKSTNSVVSLCQVVERPNIKTPSQEASSSHSERASPTFTVRGPR